MASAAIEIRGASKRYAEHVAVRDLSLTVPVGTVYGLLGPNGAGKTTTIRMILNVIAPDTGTIAVLGQPNTSAVLDRVGYLPEERGLYKKMKVKDVLIFLAELKGVPRREGLRRADEWLERLALKTPEKDWGLSKVDELSRGMQQKAMFASTLMHDPDLVILDEPFSGLDPINAQVMKDTVVELKRRGKTVIFSTHLMDNAERLCDSVCIIAHGEKVLDGTVAGVKAEHAGRFVAVSVDDATPAVKAVFGDRSLVRNVDDQNTFFELEMSPGADAQRPCQGLHEGDGHAHRIGIRAARHGRRVEPHQLVRVEFEQFALRSQQERRPRRLARADGQSPPHRLLTHAWPALVRVRANHDVHGPDHDAPPRRVHHVDPGSRAGAVAHETGRGLRRTHVSRLAQLRLHRVHGHEDLGFAEVVVAQVAKQPRRERLDARHRVEPGEVHAVEPRPRPLHDAKDDVHRSVAGAANLDLAACLESPMLRLQRLQSQPVS